MKTLRRPPTNPRKRVQYDQEQLRREDEAFRLSIDHGYDDDTVGAQMGVSGRQARTYISRARKRKVESLRRVMGVEGGYQIYSSLAYAAAEARAAWEASKEAVVREEVFIGKNDSGEGCSERIKQIVTKKGPNPAYLASFIQANLAMVNLLGLNPSELQRSSELATNVDYTVEDLKSLSTEELLIRYRKTIGIA